MSELPQGWAQAYISDLADINPKQDFDDHLPAGFVPMSHAPTNFRDKLRFDERNWGEIKKAYTNFKDGDVIFAKVTPCFENGKAALVEGLPNGIGAGSSEFFVLRPSSEGVSAKYLLALIKSREFMLEGAANMTGAVGLRRVPRQFVEGFALPVPPAAEQTRIAQKLDELLAQVDTLKARIDAIPTLLKRFRQSILAAAVSGRLTEEWRSHNPDVKIISISDLKAAWADIYQSNGRKYKETDCLPGEFDHPLPDSWIDAKIGEVFDVYVGATPSRENSDFWGGAIPWVSSSEVAFCRIKATKESVTEAGYNSASTNIHPAGTVMLAMIGQGKTRGQPAILDIEACHNQNTAAIRVHPNYCIPEYLYYYLYERYEETRRVGSGNNQQALNKKAVQSLPFPLPPLAEQAEIVRRIEQLFAFADQLEAKVTSAKSRIDHLTQSILAKAFRGELVPQDPSDEPASVLLERIKAQRAVAPKAKRARKDA